MLFDLACQSLDLPILVAELGMQIGVPPINCIGAALGILCCLGLCLGLSIPLFASMAARLFRRWAQGKCISEESLVRLARVRDLLFPQYLVYATTKVRLSLLMLWPFLVEAKLMLDFRKLAML